jgi:hypothetical protein
VHSILGLAVSILCIVGGATTFCFPGTVSHLQEDADTPPPQARREVRVAGGFLFLFGWAVLYSILTANGQPVEFIGV